MIKVFTDDKDRVTLRHNKPEQLNQKMKDAGYDVGDNDIPEKPKKAKGEKVVLYYTEKDGFWYKTETRELTTEEKLDEILTRLEKLENNK